MKYVQIRFKRGLFNKDIVFTERNKNYIALQIFHIIYLILNNNCQNKFLAMYNHDNMSLYRIYPLLNTELHDNVDHIEICNHAAFDLLEYKEVDENSDNKITNIKYNPITQSIKTNEVLVHLTDENKNYILFDAIGKSIQDHNNNKACGIYKDYYELFRLICELSEDDKESIEQCFLNNMNSLVL